MKLPEKRQIPRKTSLLASMLTCVSIWFVLAGCDSLVATPQQATYTPPVLATPSSTQNFARVTLPPLEEVSTISIEDGWSGYNTLSPVVSSYKLERNGQQFTGTAVFSVGGQEPGYPASSATEQVSIPIAIVQSFLQKLQEVPVEGRPFQPTATCCDSYPFIEIKLQTGDQTTKFFSDDYAMPDATVVPGGPWDIAVRGGERRLWAVALPMGTYTITSSTPSQAVALFQPYLKKDILAGLIDNYGKPTPVSR